MVEDRNREIETEMAAKEERKRRRKDPGTDQAQEQEATGRNRGREGRQNRVGDQNREIEGITRRLREKGRNQDTGKL